MYEVILSSDEVATGEAHLVEYPDILQNVNVQIDPGENTAWTVVIEARLDDTLPWAEVVTIAHDDDPLLLLQELGTYPQYRADLTAITGGDPVVVALSYGPASTAVLTASSPASEHDSLTD